MKKLLRLFLFLLVQLNLFCQFDSVTLQSTDNVNYISIIDENILIGGNKTLNAQSNDFLENIAYYPAPDNPNMSYAFKYERVDLSSIYCFCIGGSTRYIYKTVDNGQNWELKYTSDSLLGHNFKMFDSLNGIMLCLLNKCLITNDGGDTWYSRSLLPTSPFIAETYGDSTICASTMNAFTISDDMGLTWTAQSVNADNGIQNNFHFLNRDTIYSVTQPSGWDGFLAYSYDHGENWTNIYFQDENQIKPIDVYFFSTLEGYVCGQKNATYATIMKTIDGGQTWETFNSGIENTFINITFINDSIALMGGYDGLLVSWNKNSEQAEVLNIKADKLGVELYPNPAKDIQQLEIQTKGFQQIEIILVNADGKEIKKVFEGKISQEQLTLSNDVSELRSGAYFYKVKLDKLTKTLRFVKE